MKTTRCFHSRSVQLVAMIIKDRRILFPKHSFSSELTFDDTTGGIVR